MTATDERARRIRTVCSYCGVGCGIEVHTTDTPDGAVIARVVGDKLHPTNFGRLCTKGSTHAEMMAAHDGRMTDAFMRPSRGDEPVEVSVEKAVLDIGTRLRKIVELHGPDAVALYVSGQMSLEAQYLANKLAKGFIRTQHIESNSRLCMASAGTGYKQSLGADGPPGSYTDFDKADLFLVIGSNMADCHPILQLRMADRLRAGAKLIVVDPRRTATAAQADLFLQIKPGTDLALLNGLLHLLVASGAVDYDFIAEHTEGWDAMPQFLADYPPDRVAEITGLAESDIRAAAAMIAAAPEWMTCWTMGLNQSTHGTWNTNAICNLHLATGAICRPGSGPMSLTGQPNAMGGREMGYMGPGLPGQRSVSSDVDRVFVERVWGVEPGTIRPDVGPGTIEMFEKLAAGAIKACWIICTNPAVTVPNREAVKTALAAAELVICQDAYRDTATNRFADYLLPAALWAESDAVMINSERTLTLVNQCVPPVGNSRPDWRLICDVAAAMGYGEHFRYQSSEQIFDEIRQFWNPATGYDLRGVTYRRLRQNPVQWPSPPGDTDDRHPHRYLNDGVSQQLHVDLQGGTPRLAFPTPSRRAIFYPRPHLDPKELPDNEFPFLLNTGRVPHQWHTMTKTGRIAKLNKLDDGPFVEINPDDAARLGITAGQQVELRSRRGRAVLPAVVTDRVRPGDCFAPMHWNELHDDLVAINAVTNDAVDPDSLQPELKVCAVELTPIESSTPRIAFEALAMMRPIDEAVGSVLVLWASQTGNAEDIATGVVQALDGPANRAVLRDMCRCRPEDLASASDVIVVTSTFGDGGPPDHAADFWKRLQDITAPTLERTRYAILGIGDRSYSQFCGYAKLLDERFSELGAHRLIDRIDCEFDDQVAQEKWMRQLHAALGTEPAVRPEVTRKAWPAAELFTRTNPVSARLCRNIRLTPSSSGREVRQFGFDISDYPVSYGVGDALGVQPANSARDVASWLAATSTSGDEIVEVDGAGCSWRDALTHRYDICRITPDLLRFLSEETADKVVRRELRTALNNLEDWRMGRTGVDVVREYRASATVEQWQQVLIRLTPRFYSIASSPLVNPSEIRLMVSVVRFKSTSGISRGGVSSTFLADRACAPIPVFLQKSPHFRPPDDASTPMVMIGAGTGIAPFHGFLQHRRALGQNGSNWLFFGDRHRAENFYHRDDLTAMLDDGFLTNLDVAFSRDQQQRIYVQHKMIEHGPQLWEWLENGAHVYVCGDATRMAKDVDAALTAVIRKYGRLDRDQARDYKLDLVASRRYVRDVY
jgi:sulfite reductase (NADPH) flavoprotein alpha-component